MKRPCINISQTARHLAGLVLLACPCIAPTTYAADVFKGKDTYQTYCEVCHGSNGQGSIPGTPNFTRGQGLLQPDLALYNRIESGKNAMPAFQGVLDTDEILDVITYLRTFF